MSTRTRLDEILDDGSLSAAAALLAAFRHGVEQELAREHGRHPLTRAEPAPADPHPAPPPVPRWEHTGEYRPPKRGEWYLVGHAQEIERAAEDWFAGELGVNVRWILRRVDK